MTVEKRVIVGRKATLDSMSPGGRFGVVFEDDGETGYFYGLDTSLKDQQIVEALHAYDVISFVNRLKPSLVSIKWSEDGIKAVLLIDDLAYAIFDFEAHRGWCRTGKSSFKSGWIVEDLQSNDEVLEPFGM